jgi:hypothetical protein
MDATCQLAPGVSAGPLHQGLVCLAGSGSATPKLSIFFVLTSRFRATTRMERLFVE